MSVGCTIIERPSVIVTELLVSEAPLLFFTTHLYFREILSAVTGMDILLVSDPVMSLDVISLQFVPSLLEYH